MNPKIAFGTYRVSDHMQDHIEAIKIAVDSGVRLIDTSTNYMDGGAERAIALALNELDDTLTCKVEIVSKFGYLQGTALKRVKDKGEHFEEIVEYAEHVYHCIHPEFLKDQLTHSLSRLHVSVIHCYLIHNPEYYILDAMNKGKTREDALDEMFDRIYKAFVALELEVKAGRILSYGISSNSFSKPSHDLEFLPYEDLMIYANNAAEEAGNDAHHFTTLQLPINLLETEGLTCASWAKERGLRVLANRPLNAQKDNLMFRLAEYSEPQEYFHHLNAVLEVVEGEATQSIYNLIEQLDANRHRFGWVGEYESFLHRQIIPHLSKAIQSLDEHSQDVLAQTLDAYLTQYEKMVAYECTRSTKASLKEELVACDKRLQACALEYLIENENIDYILVGMRKPSYVSDVMNIS
ncbi:MAG: aldo/keto reductase [Campylobacterota bacterium]|nr:aldo/keto reductase [Campylobacterota bacterium]